MTVEIDDISEADIAITGMSGHFPGARDVDELWSRVVNGDDCLVDVAPDPRTPGYVARTGLLHEVEHFDPGFFRIGQRDAAIMDPQHRHFLECSWEALEAAGIVPERFGGAIGVFAGCGMNTYLINNLLSDPDLVRRLGWFLLRHTSNDKDFLATTVSYRFDLRGPSVNVQTACSTSLVAVHLAVQSLLAMECDAAIAGGVTIEVPHGVGYQYHEGGILSPDGRCRAYDEQSGGTVLTSGVGVVTLRRLRDAWADGDPVLAVIKGSAVNNDGARKVSYLAPSVDGHADVVKEALAVAGLSARDIQLVDGHGTGTPVGDPIEVAALTEAFRDSTDESSFCRLTSTKPNIGHLDTAAGVASLIKVVQAMRHRTLPPMANFTAPSALLDIDRSPFVLSGEPAPWLDPVRRAGVSSLGVGGTNAHVVVEDAPERPALAPSPNEQVLALSGRDAQAVADAAARLADHLESNPHLDLGDVAHTLAARRRAFSTRRVVAATDREHAIEQLRRVDRTRSAQSDAAESTPRVAFLFPGGGSQYVGMAAGLDARFDVFHATMRDGCARVLELSGVDLAAVLRDATTADDLNAPSVSLPAVFLTSLGLARQWMAWAVTPDAYVGHSLGEYVAAHLAGVLTIDDAIRLVVARAGLMERVGGSGAAMLVVPVGEAAATALLTSGVSLAVVNTDDECVLAGRRDEIDAIEHELTERGEQCTKIPLAAAAHSLLLDPVLEEFRAVVESVTLSPPNAPYMSNLHGTWITAEQATSPDYWVRHLRNTVRFADNLRVALAAGDMVTVELGPGQSLSSYARRCEHAPVASVAALRHPRQSVDDTAYSLNAVGQLWAAGGDVDLTVLIGSERRAVTLPTYAFQRQRYWIDPKQPAITTGAQPTADVAVEAAALSRFEKPGDMWWQPRWEQSAPLPATSGASTGRWWVIGSDDDPLCGAVRDELVRRGFETRNVSPDDAGSLDTDITESDSVVLVGTDMDGASDVDHASSFWLGTALDAVRALDASGATRHRLALVTRGAFPVDGLARQPVDALALGVAAVAPHEYPDLDTMLIDTGDPAGTSITSTAASVVDELSVWTGDRCVAHRGGQRWLPSLDKLDTLGGADEASSVVAGGAYVVTGGLGAIGHTLALHLASSGANLVVVTSSALPAPDERDAWLRSHGPNDSISQRLRRLTELQQSGVQIEVVVADLADAAEVTRVVDHTVATFGRIDGAVHAAGTLCDRLIALASPDDIETVVGVKARGAVALATALRARDASLLVLVSSTSTALAPAGQVAYVGANAVLDSLAGGDASLRTVTLNFGVWSDIGMAQRAAHRDRLGLGQGDPVAHPVFEEIVRRDGSTGHVFGHLDPSQQWLLDDHRTADALAVLPGTGHLELLLAGTRLLARGDTVGLRAVTIHEPLVVADNATVAIRVRVTDHGGQLLAELERDGGPDVGWQVHSSADVVSVDDSTRAFADVDVADDAVSVDPLAGQRDRLRLGARWDCAATVRRGSGVLDATVSLPAVALVDADEWIAHPALVDAITGLAAGLVREATGSADLFVPIGYGAVSLFDRLPETVRAVVTLRESDGDRTPAVDVVVADEAGRIVLRVDALQLWPVAADRPLGDAETASRPGTHISALTQLAEGLGIRPDEGVQLLDQLLASGHPRLLASSVDIEALRTVDTVQTVVGEVGSDPSAALVNSDATVIDRVRAIWQELLGVTGIESTDDFFDLGGHSLIAIRLMSRIQRDLGVRLQLTDIFEASSLGALSAKLEPLVPTTSSTATAATVAAGGSTGASPSRSLVQISAGGPAAPLFIVHGAGGNILFLWSLARALSGHRSVYGLQAMGVDGQDMPDPSIEAMATRYIAELRAGHAGPYLLGGYSGGGLVTLEMARQLRESGDEVTHVLLFDSVPPGCTTPSRAARLRNLIANYRRLGGEALKPWLRHNLGRAYRRVIPQKAERVAEHDAQDRALGHTDVDGYVNLFYYFSATAEKYRLSRYPVDVTVFKADEIWPVQPYDYYWTKPIDGSVEVRSVPGNHHSMFYPENVPVLAETVVRRLAEIESAHPTVAHEVEQAVV